MNEFKEDVLFFILAIVGLFLLGNIILLGIKYFEWLGGVLGI